jgi:hypothetical protein
MADASHRPHVAESATLLVCYIVDASQDRSVVGEAGTSAVMCRSIETTPLNQHVLVHQQLYAGRFSQFRTHSSFGAGVPTRTTLRATPEHKGKRLSAPGIGSFYPKPNVAHDLFLIYFDSFYSIAINNCQTWHSTFSTAYLFQ